MRSILCASIAASLLCARASSLALTKLHDLRSLLVPLDSSIDQNESDYYLGYKDSDINTSWAKYFNDTMTPLHKDVVNGLANSPTAPGLGLAVKDAGQALNQPGYLPLENGFTTLSDGTMMVATRSDVPSSFTGEMYDFWFSWHLNDTTKYKLWHPRAHQYAALTADDLNHVESQSNYRDRYWGVTSLVDEYVGDTAFKVSIGFFDPRLLGFSLENVSTGVETMVTAFVRPFAYLDEDPTLRAKLGFGPLDAMLAHQVRRKPDNSGHEIRSRFWFGTGLLKVLQVATEPYQLAHDLSVHCAMEMTHLGTFLPALFQEFKNDFPNAS